MSAANAIPAKDPARIYDAFISYKHGSDKPVAAGLQTVLQTLGRAWWQRRTMRIFRDDTTLVPTHELWGAIERALHQSRNFILIASPESAASPWVEKEIAFWLANREINTLFIAVTAGDLVWDEHAQDFAWTQDTPLPRLLRGRFRTEPLWVDLRAYRGMSGSIGKHDREFLARSAGLAAAVLGRAKEDLLSDEVRQQRRNLAWAWSAAAGLTVLAAAAGWQAFEANQQRQTAVEQRDVALINRSRLLAEAAHKAITDGDAATGTLLALEGLPNDEEGKGRPAFAETENMLLSGLLHLREREILDVRGGAVISPDGSKVAFSVAEDAVRVVDVGTKRRLAEIPMTDTLTGINFSPDGRRLVTLASGRIQIWDIASSRPLIALQNEGGFKSVSFSPDGRKLVLSNGSAKDAYPGVMLWDTVELKRTLLLPHATNVLRTAMSPDGRWIATAADDKVVRVFNAAGGTLRHTLPGHKRDIYDLKFSPDSAMLLSASADGTIRIWGMTDGALVHNLAASQDDSYVWAASFSASGDSITAIVGNKMRAWSVATGRPVPPMNTYVRPLVKGFTDTEMSLTFDQVNKRLVSTHIDDTARLWDLAPYRSTTINAGCSLSGQLVASRDATRIIAYCDQEKQLKLWSGTTGELVRVFASKQEKSVNLLLSGDERVLAMIGEAGTVYVWSVPDGRELAALAQGAKIVSAAFDVQGHRLAIGSEDGTTKVWNVSDTRSETWSREPLVIPAPAAKTGVARLAFSPAGDKLLTLSTDRTPRLWETATGKLLFTLSDPDHVTEDTPEFMLICAFSRDGRHIVTAAKGELEFWEAATGKRISRVQTTRAVDNTKLEFSPDGRRLITGGQEEELRAMEVPSARTLRFSDRASVDTFAYQSDWDLIATTETEGDSQNWSVRLLDGVTFRTVKVFEGSFSGVWLSGAHLVAGISAGAGRTDRLQVWPLVPRGIEGVRQARSTLPRCLTILQREDAGLEPIPPRWCITGPDRVASKEVAGWRGKWPYDRQEWRDWLAARDRGESPAWPNLHEYGPELERSVGAKPPAQQK